MVELGLTMSDEEKLTVCYIMGLNDLMVQDGFISMVIFHTPPENYFKGTCGRNCTFILSVGTIALAVRFNFFNGMLCKFSC